MTQQNDLCPNQSDGNHRYFVFKTAEVFVSVIDIDLEATGKQGLFYEKKEMAILGCNCGNVIKSEVRQA